MSKDKQKDPEMYEQPPVIDYTDEEWLYRGHLIKQLTRAKDQRDTNHTEFNDMDFFTWHEKNQKAANSYIPPKKNKADTRIVTGTTQEKEISLLSALLNYNLEPNIIAFDKFDLPIAELGENMEDLIKKSRIIEEYDDKRVMIYKELLDQGTCYVEEQWIEESKIEKNVKADYKNGVDPKKIKWTEKIQKLKGECRVNLVPGTKVYLGNMKEFHINKQPFLFTAEILPYSEVEAVYRNWERWQYVPRKIQKISDTACNDAGKGTDYENWSLQEVDLDMVEVVKYQNKWTNEYQIILNGVMMLPVGFPLTEISPSGEYTLVKGIAEPVSEFFPYGRSIPSKAKADQEVLDEMLKLIVLKTQKSFMPPLANRTKKILSKNIQYPGVITPDIDPNMLIPIGDVNGVSAAEFSTFELIKKIIDEKTVSPTFAGDLSQKGTTATEILEVKKQQMLKLGLVIYGVMSMERQLAWLRIQNILNYWTKAIDTEVDEVKGKIAEVFRTVTTPTTLENGQRGFKTIEFNKELANSLSPQQIQAEEKFLSTPGREYRKVYIDPEMLRSIRANWYIVINPTEKDSSELDRVLFVQNITDAMQLFGPQTLNVAYLKDRFAILAKEDPQKFFISEAPVTPGVGIESLQGDKGGQIGSQIREGTKNPSLKELMRVPSGAAAG